MSKTHSDIPITNLRFIAKTLNPWVCGFGLDAYVTISKNLLVSSMDFDMNDSVNSKFLWFKRTDPILRGLKRVKIDIKRGLIIGDRGTATE